MQTTYCPHCGAVNNYEASKPITCSKCEKPFASAFIAASVITPKVISKPKLTKFSKPSFAKAIQEDIQPIMMSPYGGESIPDITENVETDTTNEDEEVNEEAVAALAEQLKSEFDVKIIIDEAEDPVSYRNWVMAPK